jgi:hypothetical protein
MQGRFEGAWDFGGLPVEVRDEDGELVLHFPGTPDGFDSILIPSGPVGEYVIRGGEFDGVHVVFAADADRATMGPLQVERMAELEEEPPGHGLLAPPWMENAARDELFASLEADIGDGQPVAWDHPYPKHEFVRWLMERDRYIFHGSNNRDIDTFQPVRTSIELMDHGERGNLGAVYGTHDGLWSLFFAVIDRSRLQGSINNGVMRFDAPDGRSVDVYHFSVHHESLPDEPYTEGALYILPRASFRRLPMWPGGPPSNEWASESAVQPLARLLVEPGDFPFLDDIGGHDDAPLLRMQELARQLLAAGTSATELDDGFAIELAWSDATAAAYEEWLPLWERFMPGAGTGLEGDGGNRTWTLRGPDAFVSTAREWVGDLLED